MNDLNISEFIENYELMTLKTELYKNNALLLKSNKKLDPKTLNSYIENNISITFNLKLMSLYIDNFKQMQENKQNISLDLAESVSEVVKVRLEIRNRWNDYMQKTGHNSQNVSDELKSIYELPQHIDELNDHVGLAENYIQSRDLTSALDIDNQDLSEYINQNHSHLKSYNNDLKAYFDKISHYNDLILMHDAQISEIAEYFKNSDIMPGHASVTTDEDLDASLEKALAELELGNEFDFDFNEDDLSQEEDQTVEENFDYTQPASEAVAIETPQPQETHEVANEQVHEEVQPQQQFVEQPVDQPVEHQPAEQPVPEDKFSLDPVKKPQNFTVSTNTVRSFEEKDIEI